MRWSFLLIFGLLLLLPHAQAVQWNAESYEVRTGQANFQMGRQYTFTILRLVSNGIEVAHQQGSFLFNVSSDSGIPTVVITDFWNDNLIGFNISASSGVTSTLMFNRTANLKDVIFNGVTMTEYPSAATIVTPGWARDQGVITAMVLHGTGDRIVKLDFDPFNPQPPGGGPGGGPGGVGAPLLPLLDIPIPQIVIGDSLETVTPFILIIGVVVLIGFLAVLGRSNTPRRASSSRSSGGGRRIQLFKGGNLDDIR